MGIETQTQVCEKIARGKDSLGQEADFCDRAERDRTGTVICPHNCTYDFVEVGGTLHIGCCLRGINVGKYDMYSRTNKPNT